MFSSNSGCRWACYGWKLGRTLYMENDLIRIGILVDKGTDIVEFLYKSQDIDFMWRSPFPLYAQGFPETIHGKLGKFIDYYPGGWQEVFPNAGKPCEYKGADLGLHGEVATLPWDYRILEDSGSRLSIEFSVRTLRTPFAIKKTLSLTAGNPELEISEAVTNEAGEEMDFAWGHHPAFGAPFLGPDCKIRIKKADVQIAPGDGYSITNLKQGAGKWPLVEGIDGKMVDISQVPEPFAKVSDVMFLSNLDEGVYEIVSKKHGLGFRLEFPVKVFKYIWIWRIAHGSFHYPWYGRTYNLALEPFSCRAPLAQAIKNKDQHTLPPGGTLKAEIKALIIKV